MFLCAYRSAYSVTEKRLERRRIDLDKLNLIHNRPDGKAASAAIVLISIIMAGMVVWQHQSAFQAQASSVDLPPMNLTVVAPDGTQVALNETDIGNLTPYRAYGGYKNSLGLLKGLGNYTGVPINTFCDMVGGIRSGYSVWIVASDNYSKAMSFEELNGNLVTFDNVTGQEVQHNQTLTPILAYYYNDANVSSSDGPLRVAIVGPEGLCTNSTFWVKKVVRLELHANLQPMNLTVVALNGTELTLNETAISSLPALRAVGGFRNQLGIIKSLGNYTGPSLNTFCNLVGGMSNDTALRVTAADNYTKTLSYDEANGAFATYDNVTGQPVQHNQSLTPMLAYHFNDANLSLSDGPLRLAIVGPEGLATSSGYWVKQVVKLEIRYRDDVAITDVTPLKTLVGQNFSCHVNVTVENQGGYAETFNVTLYANSTVAAEAQNLSLANGMSTIIKFVWNTTGLTKGNYTLSAYVGSVPGETDTVDNTFVDGVVLVGVPCDVTSATESVPDGICNMRDIGYVASRFGTTPSSPNWNANCDVTGPTARLPDDVVNMRDVGEACAHFGQTD